MATSNNPYFVYENRLESFLTPQLIDNRRASNASSHTPKALHWPHKAPSAHDLAKAGFVYDPAPGNPDNVTCFLCTKSLDGWEEDDNPLEEHLKHAPSCGWAIMAAVDGQLGDYGKQHPLEPSLIAARKATFGGKWPHDSKKGFKCKTKQLAEAGWHYTPTNEYDDMATCAYCNLALDGWEGGDKPFDEHYKRAPDCDFFLMIKQYPPIKKSKAKATKASRLSVQSVATVATTSDLASAADITAGHDDSVLTTTSVMTQGTKKTTRAKKAPAKARKTRAKKDEPVEILEDEPQDVEPPATPPAKSARGRKRVSDAMEDSVVTNVEAPASKKRATRVRGSNAVDTSIMTMASQDTDMADVPAPKKTAAKKKARGSTAKRTRKTSQSSVRSQASTASMPVDVIDDDEIERQLQADLERPLTDDEGIAADSDSERQKAPQPAPAPTRGRPKKAATARKASTQSQPQPSEGYGMFDPTLSEPNDAEIDAELKQMEAEVEAETLPTEETLVVPKKGRKAGTRKASKQTKKAKEPVIPSDPLQDMDDDVTPVPIPVPVRVPKKITPVPIPVPVTAPKKATPVPIPLPVMMSKQEHQPEPEPADDPNTSTGTVVTQPVKRGRGRPSKQSLLAEAAVEEERRRSSGVPVQIEILLEPTRDRESYASVKMTPTPAKVARKPVPAPVPVPVPAPSAEPISTTPPTVSSTASRAPARTDKSLPPPPPQSASRLPRPPATPRSGIAPSANAKQATISPSQSPQSSDAENQPPSSKPTVSHTPKRLVLAPVVATPMGGSPSKRNVVAGLQSTTPWTAVDLDAVFSPAENADKENGVDRLLRKATELTSPEKHMTVEEWIYYNAEIAEQKLKHECEAMVSTFENEGTRAIGVLEGIVVD